MGNAFIGHCTLTVGLVPLSLRHFLYALIVAVVVYIVREVRRYRLGVRPRRPEITMEEAWDLFDPADEKNPDLRLLTSAQQPADARAPVAAQVRRSVLATARAADEQWKPAGAIRGAILASAGVAMHLEAIAAGDEETRASLIQGYQPGMDHLLRDAIAGATLEWLVLRHYARWKFDDAVRDDWFHNYVRVARPYVREKVRLAREHVLRVDSGAGTFVEVYDKLLGELAERLLKAPPKKRFVEPDLPWE